MSRLLHEAQFDSRSSFDPDRGERRSQPQAGAERVAQDDDEIDWHRKRLAENESLIRELEASNESGGEVFPETQAEIERLRAQIEQSQLIVAAHEKQIAGGQPSAK
jgi:hypothetical protein